MKKAYDLAVKVGTYMKGGEEKNRYVNIGSIMEKDDGGEFILLNRTFNPAGVPNPENRDSLIVSKFSVKDEKEADRPKPKAKDLDDEIPFGLLLPLAFSVMGLLSMGMMA